MDPKPIKGQVISTPAHDMTERLGYTPIAVMEFDGTEWKRLGYASGSGQPDAPLLSEADLMAVKLRK